MITFIVAVAVDWLLDVAIGRRWRAIRSRVVSP
jgi:hypothetical protein